MTTFEPPSRPRPRACAAAVWRLAEQRASAGQVNTQVVTASIACPAPPHRTYLPPLLCVAPVLLAVPASWFLPAPPGVVDLSGGVGSAAVSAMAAIYDNDEAYTRVQLFPLHNAVASKNFKHVQDLVNDGHDINEQHYDRVTPLHMACLTGNRQITKYLLDRGAWVNAQSIDNSTPLCDACAGGSVDCVKLLLTCGALVNPPLLPSTPLHEAALRGYTEIVALLVAKGAKLNVNDLHYGTPLHAACSMAIPSVACIRLLLKAGANVNAIKNHKTPLHYISMFSKSVEAAQLLLAYGANVYMQDSRGKTARDLAVGSPALVSVLMTHERSPRPLVQCCRLAIRSHLGPSRLQLISQLEAPSILIGFLE